MLLFGGNHLRSEFEEDVTEMPIIQTAVASSVADNDQPGRGADVDELAEKPIGIKVIPALSFQPPPKIAVAHRTQVLSQVVRPAVERSLDERGIVVLQKLPSPWVQDGWLQPIWRNDRLLRIHQQGA